MTVSIEELGEILTNSYNGRTKTFDGTEIPLECHKKTILSKHELDVGQGVKMFIEHYKEGLREKAVAYTIDKNGKREDLKACPDQHLATDDAIGLSYREFCWSGETGPIGPKFRRSFQMKKWPSGTLYEGATCSLRITPFRYVKDSETSPRYYLSNSKGQIHTAEDGIEETYFDHKITEKTTYADGRKEGPYSEFDFSGHLVETGNYHDDYKEGPYKVYDSTGKVKEEGVYESYLGKTVKTPNKKVKGLKAALGTMSKLPAKKERKIAKESLVKGFNKKYPKKDGR